MSTYEFYTVCIYRAVCQSNGRHPKFCQGILPSSQPKVMCMYNIYTFGCASVKSLLHEAIFLATNSFEVLWCRCKKSCTRRCPVLHLLNSTTCQKIEPDSSLSNGCCKNFEGHVHFRELYTKQFFVQLVSEQELL